MGIRRAAGRAALALALALAIAAAAAADFKFRSYAMDVSISPAGEVHERLNATVLNWGTEPIASLSFPIGIDVAHFQAGDPDGPLPWVLVRTDDGWSARLNLTRPIRPRERRDISLEFDTARLVRRANETFTFSTRIAPHRPIDELSLRVRLPPGHILPAELGRSGQGASIMYPEGHIETDGRNLIVAWQRFNLDVSSRLDFSVTYELPAQRGACQPQAPQGYGALALAAAFALGAACGLAAMRRSRERGEEERSAGELADLCATLDDDEAALVRAVARAGGTLMQSALTRELDHSKSKVSRTISALESRGVLRKERIGKVNRLVLAVGR